MCEEKKKREDEREKKREKMKKKREDEREKKREKMKKKREDEREKKREKMKKKRDKMNEIMKRDKDERKSFFFFPKNVSRPSNPPDELAQNVSKKNPFRTNYSSIFSAKVQNLAVFFIYLHDSNSIFRAAGINSEIFSARTVRARSLEDCTSELKISRSMAPHRIARAALRH